MNFKDPMSWGTTLGAGLLVTVSMLPQARGELVYENDIQGQQQAADREALRGAMAASQRAQATVQAQAPAPQAAPQTVVVQQAPAAVAAPIQYQAPAPQAALNLQPARPVQYAAPVVVQQPVQAAPQVQYVDQTPPPVYINNSPAQVAETTPAPAAPAEVQNMSKTELMRRERVREEVKNEDLLQERLETLRLRDENRRTEQLLGVGGNTAGMSAPGTLAPADGVGAPLPGGALKQEVIVAPITEHPGQPAVLPAGAPQSYVAPTGPTTTVVASAYGSDPTVVTSQAAYSTSASSEERTAFSITPLAGVSNMNVNNAFSVDGHYALGIALGVATSDYLSFQASYTYAEYGIQMSQINPYYGMYGGQSGVDGLILKQNSFEGGMKLHFLGPDSRIRPFVGASAGYQTSYLNYPQNVVGAVGGGNSVYGQDYQSSGFIGSLSAGLDFRVSKAMSIGAQFKYTNVLSSRENNNLNYGAFGGGYGSYGYGGGYGAAGGAVDYTKAAYGASLAQSSYTSILGGVTFTF